MRIGVGVIAAGLGAALVPRAEAQSLSVTVSRWLPAPHVTDYRFGISRTSLGPVVVFPVGQVLLGGAGMTRVGVGVDFGVRPMTDGPGYLIGGVSGGFLGLDRTSGLGLWASGSIGVGVEVLRLGPLGAVAVESRYQSLGGHSNRGVSIGLRLGSRVMKRSNASPAGRGDHLAAAAADFALGAMGTPYQWGGSGTNGFDCSGLIQFAYGRAGSSVPRRSADQAVIGREVGRTVSALRPGDILVFRANPGGPVSHVGLYLGDNRFIHSASLGVQISGLSATDPGGKWWFQRWISTRRVTE